MRRLLAPVPVAALAGVVALVALLAYGLSQNEPDRGIERALAQGDREPAPAFSLPRLDGGGELALADYRGKVVVLNVWGSWCGPCRTESPLLERWHRRLVKKGGTVVGIDVNDVTSDARRFIRDYGLTYPQLKDKDSSSIEKLGVVGVPETFVIDRAGRIAADRRGPVNDAFMREQVLPLLEERS